MSRRAPWTMPIAAILPLALGVALGGCGSDDGDTGTDGRGQGATTVTDTSSSSDTATSAPSSDDLPSIGGAGMATTLTPRGPGAWELQVTISNDGDTDLALLDLAGARGETQGARYRLDHLRTRGVDGDEAPAQTDALVVPAGTSITLDDVIGDFDTEPTELEVCLEGERLRSAGGEDPASGPTTRIGPRDDTAGVLCSPPIPFPTR